MFLMSSSVMSSLGEGACICFSWSQGTALAGRPNIRYTAVWQQMPSRDQDASSVHLSRRFSRIRGCAQNSEIGNTRHGTKSRNEVSTILEDAGKSVPERWIS